MKKLARSIALPFILSAPGLSACTAQAWYEGVKTGAENECLNQTPGAYERCVERLNKKPYEEYKKERTGNP